MNPRTRTTRSPGFDLVLPSYWWRVPLADPDARQQSIRALMKEQFAGIDSAPRVRHETETMVARVAAAAAGKGSVVLWVSTQLVHGLPLPISAVATPLDQFRVRGLDHVADQLGDRPGVDQATLPCGRVIRHAYHRSPDSRTAGLDEIAPADAGLGQAASLNVDYWVEMPNGRVLQLAFSSPLRDYEEPLTELFDTIVGTLSWTSPEES